MKFKHGTINSPIPAKNGDTIKLSYTDLSGTLCIHEEPIRQTCTYTHWAFLSIDGGGIGVFMGTDTLYGWIKDNFPTATEVFADTPVLV